jgi:RNA polymerase sigma factor (sigma-70 family)
MCEVSMSSDEATGLSMSPLEFAVEGDGWSDQEAELVRRFSAQLVMVAQRNLGRYLRHKVEPEDITQSVFRTFFRRQRLGEFELRNWSGTWGLLVRLAICKCRNRVTFLKAQCRDIRKECSLDFLKGEINAPLHEPQDTQPFPDEQTEVGEVLEQFFEGLSEDDRSILAGHLAGYRSPAISVQVGSSEQTVRRRLQQMERKLRNELGE